MALDGGGKGGQVEKGVGLGLVLWEMVEPRGAEGQTGGQLAEHYWASQLLSLVGPPPVAAEGTILGVPLQVVAEAAGTLAGLTLVAAGVAGTLAGLTLVAAEVAGTSAGLANP